VFESQKSGYFSANSMCQLSLDIYMAGELKDASSHSGRKTYISITQRCYIEENAEQLSTVIERP
jgi:hypothetical protein